MYPTAPVQVLQGRGDIVNVVVVMPAIETETDAQGGYAARSPSSPTPCCHLYLLPADMLV